MNLPTRALLWLVHAYQLVRGGRPSPCRYEPSCSSYAADALVLHGAARGASLALRRVARCHPWGGQGWDPVPERPSPAGASVTRSPHSERKVA
ncbi:MAG: membrane protein insertion efficiency factor YidD [Acidimicrobiales bacterium]